MAIKCETFLEEMTRYVGLSAEDHRLPESVGPLMHRHLPAMTERFYAQTARHPNAAKVMTGGEAQINHLRQSLQTWARRLFTGPFDEDYASERYKIGVRHVARGCPSAVRDQFDGTAPRPAPSAAGLRA